jgi:uncharacterized membrane protein
MTITEERSARADAQSNVRLEALSDGVFAIAMTLLIIEVELPSTDTIASSSQLWGHLADLSHSVLAFGLSFGIIFITWVNHRAVLARANGSSASFLYANGFLLLTVAFLPFPTGMLGEFLGTDHASPAVVLYSVVLAVQAIAWILVSGSALKDHLAGNETAAARMRETTRHGYFALALYSSLAVAAFWLPTAVIILTSLSWLFWLALGIRRSHA